MDVKYIQYHTGWMPVIEKRSYSSGCSITIRPLFVLLLRQQSTISIHIVHIFCLHHPGRHFNAPKLVSLCLFFKKKKQFLFWFSSVYLTTGLMATMKELIYQELRYLTQLSPAVLLRKKSRFFKHMASTNFALVLEQPSFNIWLCNEFMNLLRSFHKQGYTKMTHAIKINLQ
jgi:hypothetical protein